jgi:hypothetical protein
MRDILGSKESLSQNGLLLLRREEGNKATKSSGAAELIRDVLCNKEGLG